MTYVGTTLVNFLACSSSSPTASRAEKEVEETWIRSAVFPVAGEGWDGVGGARVDWVASFISILDSWLHFPFS